MKRFIALLTAVMLLVLACAMADYVDIVGTDGKYSKFKMDVASFKEVFNAMISPTGYVFFWDEAVDTSGEYNKYIGGSDDGLCTITIHEDDGIMFFEAELLLDVPNNADQAQKAGEDLGAAMVSAAMSMYIGENGTLTAEVMDNIADEIYDALSPLYDMYSYTEEQLSKGVAHVYTLCGFPAGTELHVFTDLDDPGTSYLYVDFHLCPMDCELAVG